MKSIIIRCVIVMALIIGSAWLPWWAILGIICIGSIVFPWYAEGFIVWMGYLWIYGMDYHIAGYVMAAIPVIIITIRGILQNYIRA